MIYRLQDVVVHQPPTDTESTNLDFAGGFSDTSQSLPGLGESLGAGGKKVNEICLVQLIQVAL